jgi:predicted metallopeptidase
MYASVMPLRFQGGERTVTKRGKTFAMPEVTHKDREILYLVYFALPRFQNLDFNTKLTTVFHELYHIGPKFNGDIRRFRGKNYAHGHSRKVFNALVSKFADEYMAMPGAEERTAFLRMSFGELCAVHGSVVGTKARPPKPYAVSG